MRKLHNLSETQKDIRKTNCDNLTLIIMYGETGTIERAGKKIKIVSAVDWLLQK